LEIGEYYAYYDRHKKEWDYTSSVSWDKLHEEGETNEERIEKMNKNKIAREFWERLPRSKQSELSIWGLLEFQDILVVDEKGDALNKLLHIYADFKYQDGPLSRTIHIMRKDHDEIVIEKEEFKRISIFPESIPVVKLGKVHKEKVIQIEKNFFMSLQKGENNFKTIYDRDGKYNFLNQGDIIKLITDQHNDEELFIKITMKYKMKIKDYLKENENHYRLKDFIQNQIGKELSEEEFINVYEFVRTYRQHFEG
jgi:hypothetical protein